MAHHEAPKNADCQTSCEEDGCADAFAAVAVIAIVISTVVYWLHGLA